MELADAEVKRLLPASGALPADWLAVWAQVPPAAPLSPELLLGTASLLSAALRRAVAPLVCQLAQGGPGGASLELGTLTEVCAQLLALDALLARAGPEAAGEHAAQVLAQLEVGSEALAAHAAARLLLPSARAAGGEAEAQVLRLPLLILARCTGVRQLGARELLGLARNDVAVAVAIAAAAMREPGVPPVPQLRVRLWQVLYELSTPQLAAAQARQGEENDTPIEALLAQQVAHAHRLALCLAQFGALEAVCDCAEEPQHRAALLVACLQTVHNLTASPELWAAGRVLARQMAVLWPRFGFRLLAPHLRRLLATAAAAGAAARQAARELRRDLRTLGWVLHHSAELRQYAKPLCAEMAMKAARGEHPPETLAVALGAAANAGALDERGGPLYVLLQGVGGKRKDAVCDKFPAETNRLWVIREAWEAVEDLGYWPKQAPAPEPPPPLDEATLAADVAAIRRLQPWAGVGRASSSPIAESAAQSLIRASQDGTLMAHLKSLEGLVPAFNFLDPDCEAWVPYEDWNEEDGEWQEWGDGGEEDEEEEDWWGPQYAEASGPLGLLNVRPPPPPPPVDPTGGGGPAARLCGAPEAFRCVLDGRLCVEPVRTPGGILYERRSIAAWLSWNQVCPVTGAPLAPAELVPDAAAASGLEGWLAAAM